MMKKSDHIQNGENEMADIQNLTKLLADEERKDMQWVLSLQDIQN